MASIPPEEKFIIVMGPTGSGKSTFISTATKDDSALVGHGLKSVTSEIQSFPVEHPGKNYSTVFVDTPGFDDTYKSDTEILSMVAAWFMKHRQQKAIIEGIIYTHRISDNRMAGSLLKNLQLFKDLCGADAMLKVIVVTTMWGEVREESGIKREEQLKKEFWGGILDNGGKTARFQDSFESAWGIIENLTERKEDCVLLSKEMVDRRLSLNETRVGRTLQEELKRLVKDQKQASRKLQDQAGKQRNEQAAKELLKRKEEIELKIDQVANQLSKLKISLPKQVLGFFRWRASDKQSVR